MTGDLTADLNPSENKKQSLVEETAKVWAELFHLLTRRSDRPQLTLNIPDAKRLEIHHTQEFAVDRRLNGLESIGGMKNARAEMMHLVELLKADPEARNHYGIKNPIVSINGTPGVGKTTLIEAFSEELAVQNHVEDFPALTKRDIVEFFDTTANKSSVDPQNPYIVTLMNVDRILNNTAIHQRERDTIKHQLSLGLRKMRELPNVITFLESNETIDGLDLPKNAIKDIHVPVPSREDLGDIFLFSCTTRSVIRVTRCHFLATTLISLHSPNTALERPVPIFRPFSSAPVSCNFTLTLRRVSIRQFHTVQSLKRCAS